MPSQIQKHKEEKDQILNLLKWIKNNTTKQIFKINTTKWNKKNCVYLMMCGECGIKYIGETGNTMAERFYQHKYNILKEQKQTVVRHFIEHKWNNIRITILESDDRWSRAQRRRTETRWINCLDTRVPKGLNDR